jgi:valyl-tRNA synthetase
MTEAAGKFKGMERFHCRREVIRELHDQGLLLKVVDYIHNVGHCDRCKTIVEPLLSTQWFVRAKPLAEPAIEAVEEGRIQFVPENWTKTYFEWMRNIKDWCISRQLWWGHRIPAWFCDRCHEIHVAREAPTRCRRCDFTELSQDKDVLDTWFSSGLWPFSSLGWPDQTKDLEKFYPTTLLITAFDIIFFWVARMIMLGLRFMHEVPFRTVYINSLVRDAEGQKMSKSKGNVIDPLEVMEQYGTDAVRFTLAIMAAPGTDISLSPERMLSYRAFANKIWNATRFVLLNLKDICAHRESAFDAAAEEMLRSRRDELTLVDRWILSRLNRTIQETNDALETFRFHEASHRLYHFFWHELCDWYIEFLKPQLTNSRKLGERPLSFQTLVFVFDRALKLLHPFMPFITEELWQRLPHQGVSLTVQLFPRHREEWFDSEADRQVEILEDVITKIRNLRAEVNIDPAKRIEVNLASTELSLQSLLHLSVSYIKSLARCEAVYILSALSNENHAPRTVASGIEIEVPLGKVIDPDLERNRIEREISKIEKEMAPIQRKLLNQDFLARAPGDVVELNQNRLAFFKEKLEKLKENLNRL